MSTPELHVDDLLDREARGVLSAAERESLETHLAACSVCRFERQVRADFRAEFEALAASNQAPPPMADAPPVSNARASRAPKRARPALAMLAGALLLAGAAAAELAREHVWASVGSTPVPSASELAVSPARAPQRGKRSHAKASAEADAVASAEEPAASAASVEAPAAAAASALARSAPQKSIGGPAVSAALTVVEPKTATAHVLFGEAGAARERGEYELAVRRYGELLRLYPDTAQAVAAQAILGRLLLDRGDPRAALAHFDAYLGSGARSLAEEALLGRALAFGELGQVAQESGAWRALLAAYPGSLHAARAKQRLSALEAQ